MARPRTVLDAIAHCPLTRSDRTQEPSVAREIQRKGRTGALIRVVPGAWAPADRWGDLWPEHQHAVRVMASLPRRNGHVLVSHLSAAVLHGWSMDAAYPSRVQLTRPMSESCVVNRTFVTHAEPGPLEPDPSTLATLGVGVTHRSRTAADLARSLPFREGVTMLDHALRTGTTRADIEQEILGRTVGNTRKALGALAFANGLSANTGESVFRVLFHTLGLPAPVLQHPFRDGHREAFADFWFSAAGVIVEFDGAAKYRDPEFLGGRSPEDAVIDEKDREDWLRAMPEVRGFVRLRWDDRRDPFDVRARLERAGVAAERPRRRRSPRTDGAPSADTGAVPATHTGDEPLTDERKTGWPEESAAS